MTREYFSRIFFLKNVLAWKWEKNTDRDANERTSETITQEQSMTKKI